MLQGWSDAGSDGGPQFAEVFIVYWLGATVVTLNIKLLGGSMYAYPICHVTFYGSEINCDCLAFPFLLCFKKPSHQVCKPTSVSACPKPG